MNLNIENMETDEKKRTHQKRDEVDVRVNQLGQKHSTILSIIITFGKVVN